MRIAVVGTGGVGGYFGGRLARTEQDVVFLARGAHLRAIQEHGLQVEMCDLLLSWNRMNAKGRNCQP